MYRTTDPIESVMAAVSVSETVTRDRLAVLQAFEYAYSATYRQAAQRAQSVEQSSGTARLESLRRRGSDLKELGWIAQDGRWEGQATFRLTPAGEAALIANGGFVA